MPGAPFGQTITVVNQSGKVVSTVRLLPTPSLSPSIPLLSPTNYISAEQTTPLRLQRSQISLPRTQSRNSRRTTRKSRSSTPTTSPNASNRTRNGSPHHQRRLRIHRPPLQIPCPQDVSPSPPPLLQLLPPHTLHSHRHRDQLRLPLL